MHKGIGKVMLAGAMLLGLFWGEGQVVQATEDTDLLIMAKPQQVAQELECTVTRNEGGHIEKLVDNSYKTAQSVKAEDVITVSVGEGESIHGLYVMWDSPVVTWTLVTAEGEEIHGEQGFLHEYVPLKTPQTQVQIIPSGSAKICEIRVLGEGTLPDNIQVWQPPCERADIMVISSHADDEILFFGGIMPTYYGENGATVQIVYMTEFWTTTPIREHEKLDGLWASGLDIYPVCGNFKDLYSKTLEKAKTQYDWDEMVEYLTEQFRRFKPQVVVTHDRNGEYGHGFHMLTCETTIEAVEVAALGEKYPESAETYGTWDVPKTYLHLYEENTIHMDMRVPLEKFDGMTALEVAAEAYKQHVSQQWCWFYVSDEYEYSCADFGLYRTSVGIDTNNSMLDNIVTYAEQDRIAAEKAETERLAAEEEAQRQAEEEAKRLEEEKRLAEEKAAAEKAEAERLAAEEEAARLAEEAAMKRAENGKKLLVVFCILAGVAFTAFLALGLRAKRKRALSARRDRRRK